jgi:hypothetical protein
MGSNCQSGFPSGLLSKVFEENYWCFIPPFGSTEKPLIKTFSEGLFCQFIVIQRVVNILFLKDRSYFSFICKSFYVLQHFFLNLQSGISCIAIRFPFFPRKAVVILMNYKPAWHSGHARAQNIKGMSVIMDNISGIFQAELAGATSNWLLQMVQPEPAKRVW